MSPPRLVAFSPQDDLIFATYGHDRSDLRRSHEMKKRIQGAVVAAVTIVALAFGAAALAGATGGDDDARETPITGQALDRASVAALAHTGGGKVTGTEAGDEEGAYEVEVTRADGSQVDVHLDKDFKVLSQAADGDTGEDDR
jgi:uncharacterized membrane protein YkoI